MFFETFSVLEWIFDNLFTKRKPKFPRFDSGVNYWSHFEKIKIKVLCYLQFLKKTKYVRIVLNHTANS